MLTLSRSILCYTPLLLLALWHPSYADENTSIPVKERAPLPLNELRNFSEIFERIRTSYVEEVNDQQLFDYAINGMLSSLDPHSAYLQPDDFADLQENTSGTFGGLGIEVGMEDGFITVITPIDDTPAQQAGILAGDIIMSIDGQLLMGLSLNDAVAKMRGPAGSDVNLEIRRQGEQDILRFTLARAEIKVTSVRTEMLGNDIGYIRITQFQDHTGNDLMSAIEEWREKGQLNGIILDLRNNPGGVLDAAVDVVDAFIDSGTIVYTEGRSESSKVSYAATNRTPASNIPTVVLINAGSASASEIVAGALQDHQRAIIVGTQSFGKGSVQSVLPITDDRAVKLTTALYFTPNGRSIQAQGITPDIIIEQSEVTPLEQHALKEENLPGHLRKPTKNDKDTKKNTQKNSADSLLKKDFQLYEAHTLLRGFSILNQRQES